MKQCFIFLLFIYQCSCAQDSTSNYTKPQGLQIGLGIGYGGNLAVNSFVHLYVTKKTYLGLQVMVTGYRSTNTPDDYEQIMARRRTYKKPIDYFTAVNGVFGHEVVKTKNVRVAVEGGFSYVVLNETFFEYKNDWVIGPRYYTSQQVRTILGGIAGSRISFQVSKSILVAVSGQANFNSLRSKRFGIASIVFQLF